ncbi:hypothetical protein VTN77DRAFT_9302 [Rasamsonia byssochlamydoides]|uniref:uncharacterized protein n=1 Tax=Rasamsonia byssochlamydoides TaxID=89139 RepID=UPI00374399E4
MNLAFIFLFLARTALATIINSPEQGPTGMKAARWWPQTGLCFPYQNSSWLSTGPTCQTSTSPTNPTAPIPPPDSVPITTITTTYTTTTCPVTPTTITSGSVTYTKPVTQTMPDLPSNSNSASAGLHVSPIDSVSLYCIRQAETTRDMEKFNDFLSQQTAQGSNCVHSCVLAAIDKAGKPFYTNTSGYDSVRPDAQPVTLDTTFWIASCTKTCTIIAVMQCVERGQITLDEPIHGVLPELANPLIITPSETNDGKSPPFQLRPATKRITLRHLLTHTSGLGYDYHPLLMTWRASRGETPRCMEGKVIDALSLPLLFEPGEGWVYGVGIDWAGVAVARLNDMNTLEDYFEQFIYRPLGLSSTTFRLERRPDIQARLIGTKHRRILGGAGLYSTVPEFIAIIGDLIKDDPVLLKRETIDQMCAPQFMAGSLCLESLIASKDGLRSMTGDIDNASGLNWTLAGLTAVRDTGAMRWGSVAWFGMPNLSWFFNRERGIAAVFATQVNPPLDRRCYSLANRFFDEVWRLSLGTESAR